MKIARAKNRWFIDVAELARVQRRYVIRPNSGEFGYKDPPATPGAIPPSPSAGVLRAPKPLIGPTMSLDCIRWPGVEYSPFD